jgi:EAL domain-containing protein (putative c-di-GMP-specific phosphodiesterase class I)
MQAICPSPVTRQRVLLVDDEDGIRRALGRLLTAHGFDVVPASGVAAARAELDRQVPEIVLTDLRLGDGTGLAVQEAARRLDPDLPVIFMTGADDQRAAVNALEGGAVRYLSKPVRTDEIVAAIRAALRLRGMARRGASGSWPQLRAADQGRAHLDAAFDGLYMVFQPIASWTMRRVVAYEALVRSSHPALGRPDKLIAAAERAGRIPELGRRIRRLVAGQVASLPADVDIYVNVHADELLDPELIDRAGALAPHATRVVFEITERAAIEDNGAAADRIAALRALGYRVAIDDLGAGYASLNTLAELRPDVVKIDMSLVHGVRRDPTRQVLLRSLFQLCAQLGVSTIAEGIEAADDLRAILAAGGDLCQGYRFARPGATPPPVDFESIADELDADGDGATRATGRISLHGGPTASPSKDRRDVARTLCHDARTPLIAIAALAHSLQGDVPLDTAHAAADDLLARVAQLDALLAALASVMD